MIRVSGLKKSFGSLNVLDGIDINIEKGEKVVVIQILAVSTISRTGSPFTTGICQIPVL